MSRPGGGGGGDGVERARYLLGSKVIMLFFFCDLGQRFSLLSDFMLMLQTHESLEAHS